MKSAALFVASKYFDAKRNIIISLNSKEQAETMVKKLRLLQARYCIFVDAPLDQLNSLEKVRLSKIREAFYDAKALVSHLEDCTGNPELASKMDDLVRLFRGHNDSVLYAVYHEIPYIQKMTAGLRKMVNTHRMNSLGTHQHALYKEEKETELVGMDGPRDALIKRLAEGDDSVKIVSILGYKGLGKTTLAHVVYHQLKPQFDCAAFVGVSSESTMEMEGPLSEMLRQLDVENHMNIDKEAKDESQLISSIREFLKDKRYLVVIDDLWLKEDWYSISCCLPNNGHGGRVITTTRFDDLATLCCSGCDESIYRIQHRYPDSEKLFLKRFFGSETSCPIPLTDFFYGILKMCGGTPSAIVSVASFLETEVTATKPWQEVMNSVWKQTATVHTNVPGFEDFRRIISLAWFHLPYTMKDCLLYLAVHAKNQMIHRTTVVRKWIAEGFMSESATASREEAANWNFDQLVYRNFIQLIEYENDLGEEIYEVNYVVMHVLRLISQEINFATFLSDVGISSEYAHSFRLSIQCSGSDMSVDTKKMDLSGIRSITIVGPAKFHLTNDLVYLRVLDLDNCKDLGNSAMHHICRMFLLKYLSVKHTQVTKIPQEIGELRSLETLVIRQTKISKLPSAIWKLQDLETLDVRQTQVKELPKQLILLRKLAHLYFGQCSSPQGVKLPVGSQQLESVKVFGTVDSREWSASAMEEISRLTGVKELEVVLHDRPADNYQNDKLLSSIGKCKNLKYLIIYGDYNPSDNLTESPDFPLLEKLKVAGRFMKVPQWMKQLGTLKKLDIKLCKLDQDDLNILGGLPALSNLALGLIRISGKKEVAITSMLHLDEETSLEGFTSLKVFSFECHVPWITFEHGAMPLLDTLYLKLYGCPDDKFPSGIINLLRLKKIILRYSSQYASSSGVTKAVSAIKDEASSHRNLIDLYVNGNYENFPANRKEASSHGNLVQAAITEEAASHGNLVQEANTSVEERVSSTEIEECN